MCGLHEPNVRTNSGYIVLDSDVMREQFASGKHSLSRNRLIDVTIIVPIYARFQYI